MRSAGFAHPAALLAVASAVAIIGIAGYTVVQANRVPSTASTSSKSARTTSSTSTTAGSSTKPGNSGASATPDEQNQVQAALTAYCQNTYRLVWEGAYNTTIDPNQVTGSYDTTISTPAVFEDSYAVLNAASCDTPQLTAAQKFAPFILYLQKTGNSWQGYTRTQSLADCSLFDGKGWPNTVVPQCNDAGTTRAPR